MGRRCRSTVIALPFKEAVPLRPPDIPEASQPKSRADLRASRALAFVRIDPIPNALHQRLVINANFMNLTELKQMPAPELLKLSQQMGIDGVARQPQAGHHLHHPQGPTREGVKTSTETEFSRSCKTGFGFLRSADSSYLAGPDDIYVSPSQIRRFSLRTGDTVAGKIRPPKEGERYFALLKVDKINYDSPEASKNKMLFENLTPLFPSERLHLERGQRQYRGYYAEGHRPGRADRQGPARARRIPSQGRQDHDAAERRPLDHVEPRGVLPYRAAHRRAAPRRSRRWLARYAARSSPAPSTNPRAVTCRLRRW